jgi:hypothetical protein
MFIISLYKIEFSHIRRRVFSLKKKKEFAYRVKRRFYKVEKEIPSLGKGGKHST